MMPEKNSYDQYQTTDGILITETLDDDVQSRKSRVRMSMQGKMHPEESDPTRDDTIARGMSGAFIYFKISSWIKKIIFAKEFHQDGNWQYAWKYICSVCFSYWIRFVICKVNDYIGVLTFPSIFKDNGWLFGTILILMGGLSCWRSQYMLI